MDESTTPNKISSDLLRGHTDTIILRLVAQQRNIVGLDVVELLPTENKAPDFLAAKLIYKILSYKFK